ncbi:YihY/virulence factor BrkB family protein [Marinimicrococcus flavescens]|uniref:YihY/virulence factor BrkB family protein n=1 Tax=Marinimicrococcus flavescens TaxID=3031815 RepID=A0AAP3XRF2_9PROT|nr:YihY/virulence factor BrkB family protein [Marinimicrococcus flavescens]
MAARTGSPAMERSGRLRGLGSAALGLVVLKLAGRHPGSRSQSPGQRSGGDPHGQRRHADGTAAQARRAESPAQIPSGGWKAVLWRVKDEISRDNVSIVAAGCAFYALLALFPAITATVSIYGLVADPAQVEQHLAGLQGVVPQAAFEMIREQVHKVASGGGTALGWGAALSILLALWSASAGIKTLFTALNIVYEEEEDRGFIRFNATALLFTLAAIVGVIAGLGVIVVVPAVLGQVPLGPLGDWAVRIGSWLAMLVLVVAGLAMMYRFGPSRAPASWRWISPGSMAAAVLWLVASAAFSFYAANFASYNETYGALGGVIILLMWLWISAFVVLLGAELNSELELETSRDTTTGRPQPMGQRGAFGADRTDRTRDR